MSTPIDDQAEHGKQIAAAAAAEQAELAAAVAGQAEAAHEYHPQTAAEVLSRPWPVWRVRGVLPQTGLAVLYGAPGTGKSFLILDLLMAITMGEPWFGFATKPCDCLLVPLEAAGGLRQRIEGWKAKTGKTVSDRLKFLDEPFDLGAKEQVDALIKVAPQNGIIAIDTLSAATPGLDENSSRDRSRTIAKARQIACDTNSLVLFVSHSGKEEEKGLRGHSSLLGALDTNIKVTRTKGSNARKLLVEKVKDGPDGMERHFTLKKVVVAVDDDKYDVSSCYIVEATSDDTGDSRQDEGKKKRLSANLQNGIASLRKAIDASGTTSVHIEAWRPVFYTGSTASKEDSKRKSFDNARSGLSALKKIVVENDFYSFPASSGGSE
jgi:hypothetical protein